ncbi:MAG: DUF1295 domain-containing protein [Pseudomonadota bacterium]
MRRIGASDGLPFPRDSPDFGDYELKYLSILIPFVLGLTVLLLSEALAAAAFVNALCQGVLFALVVCLPLYRTERMSYVDIGWPLGIVLIGLVTVAVMDGHGPRVWLIGAIYLFIGARMGFMALRHWWSGHLTVELPRYAYQRRRWKKAGKANTMLAAQTEVIAQGAFNASFLAFPALIIAANPAPTFSMLEGVGISIWLLSFAFEEIADRQKRRFIRVQRRVGSADSVCDIGLWAYSRHPNYFGQWMGWNGLLIAAIPAWLSLYRHESLLVWVGLGAGAALVSYYMYNTLVYYSGAVPSEYYSVQKRPAYADYQQRTRRFFPLPKDR